MTVTRRAAARVVRPLCRWLAFGGWAEVSDREPGACDRALGHRRARSRRRRDPPRRRQAPAAGPCSPLRGPISIHRRRPPASRVPCSPSASAPFPAPLSGAAARRAPPRRPRDARPFLRCAPASAPTRSCFATRLPPRPRAAPRLADTRHTASVAPHRRSIKEATWADPFRKAAMRCRPRRSRPLNRTPTRTRRRRLHRTRRSAGLRPAHSKG
ncbi:Uncharacterised protein [Burkholderia pseudomallei]|nr:Uncharacterised protein [Burkholderia pseudomallei]